MLLRDTAVMALTLWKEARNGGSPGMTGVACAILNRTKKNDSSAYEECLKPWQFSSMTAKGDPQLSLGPNALNMAEWSAYLVALSICQNASIGNLPDVVGGATLYYNPNGIRSSKTFTLPGGAIIAFPETWNPAAVEYVTEITGHYYFREV